MSPSQYIVIVGCGRLGSLLASRLSGKGHSVVVIDRNEEAFEKLSGEFSGFRITGDAVELDVLQTAKTDKADTLVATTREDNVNLMVAQVAKVVFGVEKVMARVYEPSREEIYRKFGVETISPTKLSADAFLKALTAEPEGANV